MCLDGIVESKPDNGGEHMMLQRQPELLWVVVKVESGIPVMVEAYRDKQSAEVRERSLRKCMHPENDETGVFEIQIGYATPLAASYATHTRSPYPTAK